MFASILASLAVAGTSVYASSLVPGSAHVVNMCNYDVYLCAVPSAGGGYSQIEQTLGSGQSWSQGWTSLSNGNGWSIKLSQTNSLSNILQYEYTWQNDGTIWYDLSCVNGNPWDGNWEITSSTSGCSPRQAAYMYSTDDAYGMQSCPADASITVTLCSGEAAENGTYGNAQSSAAPVQSSAAPVQSSAAAAPAPAYTPPSGQAAPAVTPAGPSVMYGYNFNADVSEAAASASTPVVTPTTFATQLNAVAVDKSGAVVGVVETVYVTEIVTAYAAKPRARRHEHHHHRHAQQ